jgi:hypothetical protein
MNRQNLIHIVSLIVCFVVSSTGQAVSPVPDGGYPGHNAAEGDNALLSLNTGSGINNTAIGWSALKSSIMNSNNTAIGAGALFANTADNNTATGTGALFRNTIGDGNTANGAFALLSNTIGFGNTAVGSQALQGNIEGIACTAIGSEALLHNTSLQHGHRFCRPFRQHHRMEEYGRRRERAGPQHDWLQQYRTGL